MEREIIKKYTGKRCLIILKNNFKYTGIIPEIDSNSKSFTLLDKFGDSIDIEIDFISAITIRGGGQ